MSGLPLEAAEERTCQYRRALDQQPTFDSA
jgi:hypothetical protein